MKIIDASVYAEQIDGQILQHMKTCKTVTRVMFDREGEVRTSRESHG